MGSPDATRHWLVERLQVRLQELQDVIIAHIRGSTRASGGENTQFWIGQREAVEACLECWLWAIVRGERWSGPVPPVVDMQARRAAHSGVPLDTAVCRYVRAQELAWALLMQEIHDVTPTDARVELQRQAWASTASFFACLVHTVIEAYTAELERQRQTREQHDAEIVLRLLAGEPGLDLSRIKYDFDGHHLGVIASGQDARQALDILSGRLGCQMLPIEREEGTIWAWLGGRAQIAAHDLERHLPDGAYAHVKLTAGLLERGVRGFRLTHKHAQAALRVARLERQRVTWYADVEPVALVLHDEELARSMITTCIQPIVDQRDGAVLLRTLQTFFACRHNRARTADALPADRHTVDRHIRRIGDLIGCPLYDCHTKVELALKVYELWKRSGYID